MNLGIAKYRNYNKANILGSCSANWLAELTSKATLKTFSDKHNLPKIGRIVQEEVDFEQSQDLRISIYMFQANRLSIYTPYATDTNSNHLIIKNYIILKQNSFLKTHGCLSKIKC